MAACKDPGRGEDGPVGGFAEKAPAAKRRRGDRQQRLPASALANSRRRDTQAAEGRQRESSRRACPSRWTSAGVQILPAAAVSALSVKKWAARRHEGIAISTLSCGRAATGVREPPRTGMECPARHSRHRAAARANLACGLAFEWSYLRSGHQILLQRNQASVTPSATAAARWRGSDVVR